MPQKKKKANNNKKKKFHPTAKDRVGGTSTLNNDGGIAGGPAAGGISSSNINNIDLSSTTLPPFHTIDGSSSSNRTKNLAIGGLYDAYKEATKAVREGLSNLLSRSKKKRRRTKRIKDSEIRNEIKLDKVNDISRASEYILDECVDMETKFWKQLNEGDHKSNDNDVSKQKEHKPQEGKQFIIVPNKLMEDLNVSIDIRTKVMNRYAALGKQDDGHSHIIKVLKYSRNLLRYCRYITKQIGNHIRLKQKKEQKQQPTSDDHEIVHGQLDTIGGRFATLLLDEDVVDDNDDDSDRDELEENIQDEVKKLVEKRQQGIETAPEITEQTDKYTIEEDLIKGGERLQACAFLFTMEQLMDITASHYNFLKDSESILLREQKTRGEDISSIKGSDLQLLMECAVAANASIQTVRHMEASLQVNYPHLSTFYHILAVVFLPNIVTEIETNLIGVTAKSKPPRSTIIDFVGSVLECSFHNTGAMHQYEQVVRRFSSKFHRPYDQVQYFASAIKMMTDMEIQSRMEHGLGDNMKLRNLMHQVQQGKISVDESELEEVMRQLQQGNVSKGLNTLAAASVNSDTAPDEYEVSHRWNNHHTFIGGNRSILSTQRWLQCIMDVVSKRDNTKLLSRPGFFGSLWDEESNPAESIQGDLDELFCGSILPELIQWCKPENYAAARRRGRGSHKSNDTLSDPLAPIAPYLREVFPLFDMLRSYMATTNTDTVTTPPIPVSLTFGMHCLLTSIIEMQGNNAVSNLGNDAKKTWDKLFSQFKEQLDKRTPNHDSFFINVAQFERLRFLPTPIGPPCSNCSAKIAFFNPFMAGCYLLFANYIISIGVGSCTVDSIGQLRFVLHLFNAFKESNLVTNDDLPLLKQVNDVFKKSKAVWVIGDGDLPKKGKFCERFLMAWGHSLKSASNLSRSSNMASQDTNFTCREMVGIEPEEFSRGYRLIVNGDFSGVVDTYSAQNCTEEVKREMKVILQTMERINMSRDAMDDDEDFVCFTNWSQIGCILNEFIRFLFEEIGWNQKLQQFIAGSPDEIRNDIRIDGRRVRPGGFNTSDVNMEYQGYSYLISQLLLKELDVSSNELLHCKTAARLMKEFFRKVDKDSYSFLVEQKTKKSTPHSQIDTTTPSDSDGGGQIATKEELMSKKVKELKQLASQMQVNIVGCVEKSDIVDQLLSVMIKEQQEGNITNSTMTSSKNPEFIRGCRVPYNSPMGPNPLDKRLAYPRNMNGTTHTPFRAFWLFKRTKTRGFKTRVIKPGKLTPTKYDDETNDTIYPYERKQPQLIPLETGKYRHIASFSLNELRQLGWDGAIYHSTLVETWVPYIDGYDSDDDDEYEIVDKTIAFREGIIGLPPADKYKFMLVRFPGRESDDDDGLQLVQLQK